MRLAVIADIHSNAAALAAVLAAIRTDGVDRIIQLGDAVNGPIDPAGVMKMLRATAMVHVRGNGDRMTADLIDPAASRSAVFARERLGPDDLAFLSAWPSTASGDTWLACHGSPRSDTEYLLEEVTATGVQLRPPESVAQMLGPVDAALVLCGHTHLPRVVALPGGRLVLNPGSVGLPAYDDAEPWPHRMETGTPHARYAVVDRTPAGWSAELRAVTYDWEEAARVAERNGFPSWGYPLRTGRCAEMGQ